MPGIHAPGRAAAVGAKTGGACHGRSTRVRSPTGWQIPIAPQREDPGTYELAFEKARAVLADGELLCIFPEGAITRDGELGEFKGGVMKLLTGEVKEFERMAITLADVETVDSFLNVAVISSLVASAKRGMLRDNLEQEKRFSNSEWQAAVKANIVLKDLEVLVCTYSENFASYRFEGKIDGNFFSWWGKEKIAVGTKLNGKARVKAHATDSKSGAKVTQINYLKVA